MTDPSDEAWFRNPLIQFCAATVIAVLLVVFAAMLKDMRWLLALVWPFVMIAIWEFTRISKSTWPGGIVFIGSIISGALLGLVYFELPPVAESAAAPTAQEVATAVISRLPPEPRVHFDEFSSGVGRLEPPKKNDVLFSSDRHYSKREIEIGDSGTIFNYNGQDGKPVFVWG